MAEMTADTTVQETPEQLIAKEFAELKKGLTDVLSIKGDLAEMKNLINEKGKGQAPSGHVDPSPTSRPYSFQRHMRGLVAKAAGDVKWRRFCPVESDIGSKLAKAYGSDSETLCPLSTHLMQIDYGLVEGEEGEKPEGVPANVIKEIQDHFGSHPNADLDELKWLKRRGLLKGTLEDTVIEKTANNYSLSGTGGATLVPLAVQGELIELLRNSSAFARAGVRQFPLPPNGTIRYPRQNGANTVTGYAEAGTISETELTTDSITMIAQAYSGLSKVTEDLLKFASISVEALIREDLMRVYNLAVDRDCFDGPGHGSNRIPGLMNLSGITTLEASTPGTNGDTLGTSDIGYLVDEMNEVNAPTELGVNIITRPKLWGRVSKRKDSFGRYVFDNPSRGVGMPPSTDGHPITMSTNCPQDRAKGSATNLTSVLVIVPSEILMGLAGVVDMAQTNSDGTDFTKRILAFRLTGWTDLSARHNVSVGLIDDLILA